MNIGTEMNSFGIQHGKVKKLVGIHFYQCELKRKCDGTRCYEFSCILLKFCSIIQCTWHSQCRLPFKASKAPPYWHLWPITKANGRGPSEVLKLLIWKSKVGQLVYVMKLLHHGPIEAAIILRVCEPGIRPHYCLKSPLCTGWRFWWRLLALGQNSRAASIPSFFLKREFPTKYSTVFGSFLPNISGFCLAFLQITLKFRSCLFINTRGRFLNEIKTD